MEQRVAMISGASRGIGAAIAKRLIADGWAVSLGIRNTEAADLPSGDSVLVCPFDATKHETEKAWVDATLARFGRLDGLVHNAGIMIHKTVLEATGEDFDQLFEVNVKSPMRLTQLAWPHLVAGTPGRIVTLASLSGKRVKSTGSSFYALSKFAVVGLAHAFRQCGKETGVRSTAICPSFVATDMATGLTAADPKTLTQPEDIAALAALVLSLPPSASIAEIPVHYGVEDCF